MTNNHSRGPDPRWDAKNRDNKGHAILQTVSHFIQRPLKETEWLDIGCGNGIIAATIAPSVKFITGADPGAWPIWDTLQKKQANIRFLHEPIEKLTCHENKIDIVICNQVYEHVADPQYLIQEIKRVLKPGGYCYFAGPNLFFPIEPHVFWPFIHWLPRNFAVKLMRKFGSKGILDAWSTDYWTLIRWLDAFEIINAVPYILKNPKKYNRTGLFWKALSLMPNWLLNKLTWVSPTFVFILKKPTA
ncbi:MAG: class I SAM-dependent methyltransferase [Syntrophales bacterium]|jgi:2-polyprenyl-3-methyl-5-hydroxy-6-metoxy-1,4-benzoquinol methylase|nr:class I SAM-dependent methyltransferase [Syntrophales bacterium]